MRNYRKTRKAKGKRAKESVGLDEVTEIRKSQKMPFPVGEVCQDQI